MNVTPYDPEKRRVSRQRYRQSEKHRETLRRRREMGLEQEYQRRYRQSEKGKGAVARERERGRWRRHGITIERAAEMLADQGGVCAVYGKPLTLSTCQIDHDHQCCPGGWSCGKCIRGLVSSRANKQIMLVETGRMTATPEITAYLRRSA